MVQRFDPALPRYSDATTITLRQLTERPRGEVMKKATAFTTSLYISSAIFGALFAALTGPPSPHKAASAVQPYRVVDSSDVEEGIPLSEMIPLPEIQFKAPEFVLA
jgi:hypothetical protein